MVEQLEFHLVDGGSIPTSSLQLTVRKIPSSIGKDFIKKHHYSHGVHNGPMCYGLFDSEESLVGVCAFATPCSENVCSSVFGTELKRSVTELHRLVLLDEVPKNSESFFISKSLMLLKKDRPNYSAVLSFADSTEGHLGIIYQASNFLYTGTSGKATFYLDSTGRLRHPRQNGINITKESANSKGWVAVKREGKFRYLYLLPDNKKHKKELVSKLRFSILPYPKKIESEVTRELE